MPDLTTEASSPVHQGHEHGCEHDAGPPVTAVTGSAAPAAPGPIARLLVASVRVYQRLFAWRPSPCRYWPSCSAYAVEALQIHGAWRGTGLAVWRIMRCNPFAGHGVDPVPEKKKKASRRV